MELSTRYITPDNDKDEVKKMKGTNGRVLGLHLVGRKGRIPLGELVGN